MLSAILVERGSIEPPARRFDGIRPPEAPWLPFACVRYADAVAIIEVRGGHIEHL